MSIFLWNCVPGDRDFDADYVGDAWHFCTRGRSNGRAIITAVPNKYHEVGARMVLDQLEMDGWQVDYLGRILKPRICLTSFDGTCRL